jgi:hypothetical protein
MVWTALYWGIFSGDRLAGFSSNETSWFISISAAVCSANAGEWGCIGRLSVCFEYISFNPLPSSEMFEWWSCDMLYTSAEALLCIIERGGDWSTIAGSPWLMNDSGETEGWIIPPEGSTIGFGERYGTEKGVVLYDDAGRAPESGPCEKKPGLAKSDGEVVVAADIGYCRKSIP